MKLLLVKHFYIGLGIVILGLCTLSIGMVLNDELIIKIPQFENIYFILFCFSTLSSLGIILFLLKEQVEANKNLSMINKSIQKIQRAKKISDQLNKSLLNSQWFVAILNNKFEVKYASPYFKEKVDLDAKSNLFDLVLDNGIRSRLESAMSELNFSESWSGKMDLLGKNNQIKQLDCRISHFEDISNMYLLCGKEEKEEEIKFSEGVALGMAGEISSSVNVARNVLEGLDVSKLGEINYNILNSSIEKIDKIIEMINGFTSKSKNREIEIYSVGHLIKNSLDIIGESFKEKNIKIEAHLSDLKVRCIGNEVQHVLLNLMRNARNAADSSRVRIVKIETKINSDASRVMIMVKDSGAGIEENFKKQLFDSSGQTNVIKNGLGLDISRKMIVKNNGRLYLDNQSTQTCFILELPYHEDELYRVA